MFQREGPLLRSAPEYQRIATLQTAHDFPRARVPKDQIEDLLLRGFLLAFVLSDIDPSGIRPRQMQHLGAHQPVVEHDIALLEQAHSLDGQ